MPTSLNISDNTVTEGLRAGSRITFTMAASSTALVQWYRGDTLVSSKSLIASEVFNLGEFRVDMMVRITCLTGTMTYTDAAEDTGLLVGRATKTNDDAAAGEIGEIKTATVLSTDTPIGLSSTTPKDVVTLSLTPGDWDVWGQVDRNWASTTASIVSTCISVTTDTMSTQPGGSGIGTDPIATDTATFGTTLTGIKSQRCGPVRVTLAATTTLHLVAKDTFGAGTVTAFGTITARRVR